MFFNSNPVEFNILVPKDTDRQVLQKALEEEGIAVSQNTPRSDYIRCKADKKTFCRVFNTKLRWKTMRVGSWELKDEGHIPESLKVKEVHLHRNILLPTKFITKRVIK